MQDSSQTGIIMLRHMFSYNRASSNGNASPGCGCAPRHRGLPTKYEKCKTNVRSSAPALCLPRFGLPPLIHPHGLDSKIAKMQNKRSRPRCAAGSQFVKDQLRKGINCKTNAQICRFRGGLLAIRLATRISLETAWHESRSFPTAHLADGWYRRPGSRLSPGRAWL